MLHKVRSLGLQGIYGYEVSAECDLAGGLPNFDIVGLPDAAVKEARERVRSAIKNNGYSFPVGRITVNLAPANLRKSGTVYDLPIFVGILTASGQLDWCDPDCAFVGELSLSGTLRPVVGMLPMALAARAAGIERLFVPADGRGQEQVKRMLEIAAAGGHNAAMIGPPGSGKSMLARRLPSILPPMTRREALEATQIHSVMGLTTKDHPLLTQRPFRSPHHTISAGGMAGGGNPFPRPGEISLAHHGVLFLDELPEFHKDVVEVLRQPMEEGKVTVVRSAASETYPSHFMLLCAMNPCKCGWFGHPSGRCRCTPAQVKRYLGKLSGPMLDRIDLFSEVPPLEFENLADRSPGEPSAAIRARVTKARERQSKRFGPDGPHCNAAMGQAEIRRFCALDDEGQALMKGAYEHMGLTARSYDRILRVARTIADLDESENIQTHHLAEAIQYRETEYFSV